ncbi:MAG: MFS transporter [Acidimicrobiales bacterium]
MSAVGVQTATIETAIPSRLDRLPWTRFHWMIILGLGTAWVLDGLEVTLVGSVASRLTERAGGLNLSVGDIGLAAAVYVAGACIGALFFGQLCDRFGRKKLFMITLGLYIASTVVTAFSFVPWFFFLARFFTGSGIGGEYSAINSAIDELIPARVRGRVDLIINGSYWLGSIAGAGAALFFLSGIFPENLGWRFAFGVGAVLGITVMFVRRSVPESPRWLFIHGREEEAEAIVGGVEHVIEAETGQRLSQVDKTITVRQRATIPFREIARVAFKTYPRRSILCLALFIGQAFLYNGVTFNLGTLMTTFYGVGAAVVPVFFIVFAVGNFAGPLLLGRLFDTVGRKPMISGTYLGSAVLSVVLAGLFVSGVLNSGSFIIVVVAVFFLASAGASAAYLTASEIFPMETRALAIAFFYAIGTAVGGIIGPLLFGKLIATGHKDPVAIAFLIGAAVMALGGVVDLFFGVKAAGVQLEDIATPLTAVGAGGEPTTGRAAAAGRSRAGAPALSTARATAGHHRAQADEERARASEHRAMAHEQLARVAAGEKASEERAKVEQLLAEVAEMAAVAHDDRAAAADALANAETEADPHLALAAHERARAAEQRARAHDEDAAALSAPLAGDAERHQALAAAAAERARSREQKALAEQCRAAADSGLPNRRDIEQARADMHDRWAEMHAQRARAHEQRAERDEAGETEATRAADVLAEEARAAEDRIEAAEHRADAEEERREEATTQEIARRRDETTARQVAEERIRARIERRLEQERTGLRRYRLGPGRISASPGIAVSSPLPPQVLDSEIRAIEKALDEHGATERHELAQMVGARYWGPGVFRDALREAVIEGTVRRTSRSIYEPAQDRTRRGEER